LLRCVWFFTGTKWVWEKLTFTTSPHNIVHIALVIGLGTKARNSHGLSLKIFSVEALRILLSSDVSNLLTEEALVVGTMSSIVMRTPKLEV